MKDVPLPKVSVIQMCSSHVVEDNLKKATELLRKAHDAGTKLVVLPENFACMGLDDKSQVKHQEDFGFGIMQDTIRQLAEKLKLWIVAGTIPIRTTNDNKIYATTIVYDDKGNVAGSYAKSHLFDVALPSHEHYMESDYTIAGNDTVVVESPIGRLGLAICFDIRFPELFIALKEKQVDVIAIPAAFTYQTGVAHWDILTRARALDTFSFVLAAAQGGHHTNGRKTYGHAAIIGPWGDILNNNATLLEGVTTADIDLQAVKKARSAIPI